MTQQTVKKRPPVKVSQKRTYDEIIDYFWWDLYGQVYTSWDTLPVKVKDDYLAGINIQHLSDSQVQELFSIRHENNKENFKQKLTELVGKSTL